MKKLILSILSFFVITSVPTVTYAITVTIKQVVGGVTTDLATLGSPGATSVQLAPCAGTAVPPCTATYGQFTISDASATKLARVFFAGATFKKLTLTDAVIKRATGTPLGSFADILIKAMHTYADFVGEVDTRVDAAAQQYHGLSAAGNFLRGTAAATGAKIEVKGFGGFVASCGKGGCATPEDQIGPGIATGVTTLSYTVGTTLASNTITPSPLETTDNFSCNNVFPVNGSGCDLTVPAFVRTEVTVHLRRRATATGADDTLKLLGSVIEGVVDSTVIGDAAAQEARDQGVFLSGLPIDIKPDSKDNNINLKKGEVIKVAILGTATFDVTTIDESTVELGPKGAKPVGPGLLKDVSAGDDDDDGDGFLDLVLGFNTQDTGWECGDTSGTLTGQTNSGDSFEGTDSIRVKPCK